MAQAIDNEERQSPSADDLSARIMRAHRRSPFQSGAAVDDDRDRPRRLRLSRDHEKAQQPQVRRTRTGGEQEGGDGSSLARVLL
jgi:hypothetical protein